MSLNSDGYFCQWIIDHVSCSLRQRNLVTQMNSGFNEKSNMAAMVSGYRVSGATAQHPLTFPLHCRCADCQRSSRGSRDHVDLQDHLEHQSVIFHTSRSQIRLPPNENWIFPFRVQVVARDFQETLESQDTWSDCSPAPPPSFLRSFTENLQMIFWVFRENQVCGDQTDLRENLGRM